MVNVEAPILRPLIWVGDSLRQVQDFPVGVQKTVGDELQLIQFGGMPTHAKPFKGIGSGVFALVSRFDTDAYRTVVAVQIGRRVYVLHAFQKKSKRGIATSKRDVELIKRRYREAQELATDE